MLLAGLAHLVEVGVHGQSRLAIDDRALFHVSVLQILHGDAQFMGHAAGIDDVGAVRTHDAQILADDLALLDEAHDGARVAALDHDAHLLLGIVGQKDGQVVLAGGVPDQAVGVLGPTDESGGGMEPQGAPLIADKEVDLFRCQPLGDPGAKIHARHMEAPSLSFTVDGALMFRCRAGPRAFTSSVTFSTTWAKRSPSEAETQENCTRPFSMPRYSR